MDTNKHRLFLMAAIICILLIGCKNTKDAPMNEPTIPTVLPHVTDSYEDDSSNPVAVPSATDVQNTDSIIPSSSKSESTNIPETRENQAITNDEGPSTVPETTYSASEIIQPDINWGSPGEDD